MYKPVLALNARLENREQKNAQARIHPPSCISITEGMKVWKCC
jgi:hypothetical protein